MEGSGVYKIQSIIHPERCYIGSTLNFKKRWRKHLLDLQKNIHNPKLQNHFNKYGVSDLVFIIVEPCLSEFLVLREQYYIDLYKPWFNIRKVAESNLGIHPSEESRKRMSAAHIGLNIWLKGKKLSKQHCDRLSKSHMGRMPTNKGVKVSELTLKKMSESKMGEKNSFYNKRHSADSKKKQSESCKKAWVLRKMKKSA